MGAANWAIFYVQVEDVQAAVDRAIGLGAAVVLPFVNNGAIEFAHLTDPLGNRFGIWRPKTAQMITTAAPTGHAAGARPSPGAAAHCGRPRARIRIGCGHCPQGSACPTAR